MTDDEIFRLSPEVAALVDRASRRIQNRASSDGSWFRVTNAAKPKTASIDLYDEIGMFGVTAADFRREVKDLDVDTIELHINSPGGSVFDGLAILNTLRQHKARVVVTIDGLAASAASLVAMSGDEVVMARNAEMVIHDATGVCLGNAQDMHQLGDVLDKISDNIARAYAARAGGTAADWRSLMLAETWLSDEEAVEAGLADRVLAADPDETDKAKARFDLSMFNYAGRKAAPERTSRPSVMDPFVIGAAVTSGSPPTGTYTSPTGNYTLSVSNVTTTLLTPTAVNGIPTAQIPPAEPAEGNIPNPTQEVTVAESTTLRDGVLQRLGVTDTDADDATILNALDEVLTEQTEPVVIPELVASVPEGTVLIDSAQLDELRVAAQAGQQAHARQVREDRERLVSDAVTDGRIPPARRDHWLRQLEADAGSSEILAGLEKGLIPVGEPIGHSNDTSDDDALLASLGLRVGV